MDVECALRIRRRRRGVRRRQHWWWSSTYTTYGEAAIDAAVEARLGAFKPLWLLRLPRPCTHGRDFVICHLRPGLRLNEKACRPSRGEGRSRWAASRPERGGSFGGSELSGDRTLVGDFYAGRVNETKGRRTLITAGANHGGLKDLQQTTLPPPDSSSRRRHQTPQTPAYLLRHTRLLPGGQIGEPPAMTRKRVLPVLKKNCTAKHLVSDYSQIGNKAKAQWPEKAERQFCVRCVQLINLKMMESGMQKLPSSVLDDLRRQLDKITGVKYENRSLNNKWDKLRGYYKLAKEAERNGITDKLRKKVEKCDKKFQDIAKGERVEYFHLLKKMFNDAKSGSHLNGEI